MGLTFANPIESRDVSLAIEKFVIADFGTPWVPDRVNINSVPAGFRDLGPVDEESPNITISRNQFQLRTGIPQVIQFQAVTSMDARVTFNIQTRDSRAMIAALAAVPNNAAQYVPPTGGPTTIGAGPTQKIITLSASPQNNWFAGDMVVAAINTESIMASQNWAVITSVNGLEIHMRGKGFSGALPALNEVVMKPEADFLPFGTAALPQSTLLGVADFIDGYQLIHRFDKVQGSAEITENIRSSENNKIPFAFNVFGLESSTWGNELVLGERYLFQRV